VLYNVQVEGVVASFCVVNFVERKTNVSAKIADMKMSIMAIIAIRLLFWPFEGIAGGVGGGGGGTGGSPTEGGVDSTGGILGCSGAGPAGSEETGGGEDCTGA
jgi:hypothetical protein